MHKRWIAQKKFLTHCLPPSKQLLCNQSKTHNKMKDKGEKSIIRPENHSVSFFIGRETKKLNKMLVTLTAMNIHRQTPEKLHILETLWFFSRPDSTESDVILSKKIKPKKDLQGRHGRFFAGKTAGTSKARRRCCRRVLFCKIQARPRSWRFCLFAALI